RPPSSLLHRSSCNYSQAHLNTVITHVLLGLAYGVFTIMKNAGSQHRIGTAFLHAFNQMHEIANTTGSDDRHIDRIANGTIQWQVEAGSGSISIHAGNQ